LSAYDAAEDDGSDQGEPKDREKAVKRRLALFVRWRRPVAADVVAKKRDERLA
jgi:hypothetical protein